MEAFFKMFKNYFGETYYMSFAKINGRWCPLSASGNTYATKESVVASVDDILLDRELLAPFSSNLPNFEMDTFLKETKSMDYKIWSIRTRGQSPVGRVSCLIKTIFYRNKK
jgi:hypothetical protein